MPKPSQSSLRLFAAPEVPKRDKDADLKLRVARYFWSLGYICPMEVALSGTEIREGALKRYDITDVDVVGIKFENDLTWHTAIADCKSGRISTMTRLFWLRGVMEFFGASRGYLAMPKIGRAARELALRMSVSLLDSDNLKKFEADKGLVNNEDCGFSLAAYDKRQALWGLQLAKGEKPSDEQLKLHRLYQFLAYRYWFHDEYLNVQQTVTAFTDAHAVLNNATAPERAKAVAYVGLTAFSIALLKMCGSVISTKSEEIHNEVRRYIFGGAANALERHRLMHLLSGISKQTMPLEPPYYDELLELSNRLIKYSQFAKDVPRYVDLVFRQNVLCANDIQLEDLLGQRYEVDTLKLAKDVAEFLCKASGLNKGHFEALLSQ